MPSLSRNPLLCSLQINSVCKELKEVPCSRCEYVWFVTHRMQCALRRMLQTENEAIKLASLHIIYYMQHDLASSEQ